MVKLAVSECFGPTLQGEGPSAGQPAIFLRLAGCNLSCVWCDSAYTWDWTGKNGIKYDVHEQSHIKNPNEVLDEIVSHFSPPFAGAYEMLVITGGEPLLQQKGLIEVLKSPSLVETRKEIETAGTIEPTLEFLETTDRGRGTNLRFNVSPKLAHSGNPLNLRYRPEVLREFNRLNSIFKFVVEDIPDLEEVDYIVAEVHIHPNRVWIMPCGIDQGILNDTSQIITEGVIKRHYNLTGRLHIALWGNTRGH